MAPEICVCVCVCVCVGGGGGGGVCDHFASDQNILIC